jgi:1,4-dihydroxy-2-naphthoate octaprenyltransferase
MEVVKKSILFMLVSLKISSVLLVSTVPLNNDYKDYSKYRDFIQSEIVVEPVGKNKSTLEYNTMNSQEYIDFLLEKSFYSPIIKELEKSDAR